MLVFSARLAVKDPGSRPDSRRIKSSRRNNKDLNKSLDASRQGSRHSDKGGHDKAKSTKADKRASARSRR